MKVGDRTILPSSPLDGVLACRGEIMAAIERVVDRGRYILGPEVEEFEREFSSFLGAGAAVGVASGTDAIELGLRACGVGPGDRVLTVSHTAVATVAGIEASGAEAVLVDVDPGTGNMDPESVRAYLRGRPSLKAIVVVHLYGRPAEIGSIFRLAKDHGLFVIEDCAQAHGASLDGRSVGTLGDVGAFSFYPTKNLGALGDGGAVVTSDPQLESRLRHLRQYGWQKRYVSEEVGVNSRLDELQAAVLRVRLKHLPYDNRRRQALAEEYDRSLPDSVRALRNPDGAESVYHQYVIRTTLREELRAHLHANGVETLVHYPVPVHLQPAYRRLDRAASLSHSEELARSVLSLPIYPELSLGSVRKVSNLIHQFVRSSRPTTRFV